jgi:hypothetical protein
MLSPLSMAFFRIAIASTVLLDLGNRIIDLSAHYTDVGILPSSILLSRHWNEYHFSFHLISGHIFWQMSLMVVAAVVASLMAIGYKTRLMTALSWLLLISLQNRNPLILQGGDVFLRAVMFWAMFLPIGMKLSVDSYIPPHLINNPMVTSSLTFKRRWFHLIPELCMMLQISYVYVFAGIIKWFEPSWQAGEGLFYALHTDQFTTRLALWLQTLDLPLKVANDCVIYGEIFLPLLMFVPYKNRWFRLATVFSLWGLHLGIALILKVGIFSLVGVAASLIIVPDVFWNNIPARLYRKLQIRWQRIIRHFYEVFPTPEFEKRKALGSHKVTAIFCGLLGIIILNHVLSSVPQFRVRKWRIWQPTIQILRLDQKWDMFSKPLYDDGWLVIPGLLKNGQVVDLNSPDHKLRPAPTTTVSATYRRQRWRKYLMNITSRNKEKDRLQLAQFLCRNWNKSHRRNERLLIFHIIFMQKWNRPDRAHEPEQPMLLWKHQCFGQLLKSKEPELIREINNIAPRITAPK